MEIKEIGGTLVLVAGGAIYGISQVGLGDALSEDVRHISEFTIAERADYMTGITNEFSEAFDTYYVATESDYVFEGQSSFSIAPSSGTFMEVVRQENPVPEAEWEALKTIMASSEFCAQDEMVMFTEKGWKYRFRMIEGKGRQIFAVTCRPASPEPQKLELRGLS